MPPMLSGWLTRRSYSCGLGAGRGLVVEVGDELACLPGPPPVGHPVHVEVGDAEGERLHHARVEQAAGSEVVVLGEVVGEAVLLPVEHDDATLVAEQAARRDADQHHDHGEVEEQVARLAQVTALGRHGVVVAERGHAVVLGPHQLRGPTEHDVGLLVGDVRRALRQSREMTWRPGRLGPQRPPVDEEPRDDAADERDHQQDVDRGEPRRGVDREEVEPVPDRRQTRVVLPPGRDGERVDVLLRDHRAGDRRERQQEQQDQRRAHRRQLAPAPAGELTGVEVAGQRGRLAVLAASHTGTTKPSTTCSWSHWTSTSHQPVTSRTPTAIIITPPSRTTNTWWRRTTAYAPSMRR